MVILTLNRPARLNALTRGMRDQLRSALHQATADESVGAVILQGAGDRAFSAGQDLDEAKSFGAGDIDAWIDDWETLYSAVLGCPKPVVASVSGYAVGAAFQLALVCDLRIASDAARFGMPEIDDAIPCITGTWALYNVIGRGRVTDLVLTGRMLPAAEALDWGIVNRVTAPDELHARTMDLARLLATKPRMATGQDKSYLRARAWASWAEAAESAKIGHTAAFASGEPQRVMEQFFDRDARARSR